MNTEASSQQSGGQNGQLTGAEILVRCLAEEGVEHVFGYPGGAVLYIYDAIFKQDKFQHVLVRHEQAAVHAADAYSRANRQHARHGPAARGALSRQAPQSRRSPAAQTLLAGSSVCPLSPCTPSLSSLTSCVRALSSFQSPRALLVVE